MTNVRLASYLDRAREATAQRRFDKARAFERLAADQAERDSTTADQLDAIDRQVAERLAAEGDPAGAARIGDVLVGRRATRGARRDLETLQLLRDTGLWRSRAGDHAAAADRFEQAVDVAGDYGNAFWPGALARYSLAHAYVALGRRADAVEQLDRAAAICDRVADTDPETAKKIGDTIAELSAQLAERRAVPARPPPAPTPREDEPPDGEATTYAGQVARPSGATQSASPPPPPPDRPVDEAGLGAALAELDELVGLEHVKAQVHQLADFLRVQRLRDERGHKTTDISYHLQLIGPPGTGKTTVARLLARIYFALGILGTDRLVEATRADMVAGYIGQTAPKTNAVVDSALDGMLFIDEAYSLGRSEAGAQDFGAEAIAELVKRMEDDRGRLVVVVAGYSKEMEEFLTANSGLRERFAERLDFPDYTPDELVQIFERLCRGNDYALTGPARPRLAEAVSALHARREPGFANARTIRNRFEDTIKAQATRLADREIAALTDAELTAIEPVDVDTAFGQAS